MHRITLVSCFLIGCGGHHPGVTVDATPPVPDGPAPGVDAPLPATYPRLVVAGAGGVQIWDHADALAAVRAPDATLSGVTGALGLAVGDDMLFVTATSGLYRFAPASTLADAAAPTGSIAASAFSTPLSVHTPLRYETGNLWVETGGEIDLVSGAPNATSVAARFTHPWGQIASLELDAGRLLGGQISGAGMLVWNAAATRTGTVTPDWTLDHTTATHTAIVGGRLYTSAYAPPTISIWTAISSVSSATPPNLQLTSVCGTGNNSELRYMTVTDTDVLVVIHNELVNGTTQIERVCLFQHASTLTGAPTADAIAADPQLHASGSNIDKAVLAGDRLYVMDHDGITIFDHALTSPTRVMKLLIQGPQDFVVLE
jgi:hypothetical protein